MSFKEVTNDRTGRTTHFVDGRRVSRREYADKSADLSGYNSSCSWTENGRHYHAFCTSAA